MASKNSRVTMHQVRMFFQLLVLAQLLVRVSAQTASFGNAILGSRTDIEVSDGHLLGPGAAKIQDATAHTCYVFLGEDYGIREVLGFAEALTSNLVDDGVQTLALEVSPSVATAVIPAARQRRPQPEFCVLSSAISGNRSVLQHRRNLIS